MNKIWVIGDTHFGHNMLRKGHRPEDFEEQIISNWYSLVEQNDTVIHLGDFSFGKYTEGGIEYSLGESVTKWRERLVGRVILVRGNHDKEPCTWYMNHGFEFCCDELLMDFKGKKLRLSHIPVQCSEINIHGHLHNDEHRLTGDLEWYGSYKELRPEMYHNVSADVVKFRPILLEHLIK